MASTSAAYMAATTFTSNILESKQNPFFPNTFPYLFRPFSPRNLKNPKFFKFPKMTLSNDYMGIGSFNSTRINYNTPTTGKFYKRMDSCLVIPPPKGIKPKAIIKFVGGAFIGAVPEVTYSYLLENLAREGYLIICVPYNVTFDHAQVTRQVFDRFHACFDSILASGLPDSGLSAADIVDLPLYSVGHSNGALIQALVGSYFCEKIPKANVIISYNNRPASEAVPYFEQLGLLVGQMVPVISPAYSMAQSASGDALRVLLDTAGTIIPDYDPETVVSLTKFADQLPSVFGELAQGISEFKPTPSENLECFKNAYNVKRTLLVKFDNDAIDETDRLEETLKPRVESFGGKVEKIALTGNHITPCVQEPKWRVGTVYTPADAIAQVVKTLSINDTKGLCTTIANWFSCLEE
ncbi:hypothetical protein KY290_034337 [Solanum tuberosum]|uniref:Uncharacterized protein n=1 Tax=Solanum tuberosum TaxID=4113 RepID=A0ABQ7U2Y8_SOLTU|nr:hypothetical protein KY284_033437 [Solanum tuberosum]KAH0741294.1 hypothetical protein KY290_034337 [Solanum tuberosum]